MAGYKNMNHQVFRKSSNLEHYIYNDISSLVLLVFVIFRYEFHILCRLTFYVYGNHSENCFRSETENVWPCTSGSLFGFTASLYLTTMRQLHSLLYKCNCSLILSFLQNYFVNVYSVH